MVALGYPVQQSKFQGHLSIGSGEEYFKMFTCMGVVAILVM